MRKIVCFLFNCKYKLFNLLKNDFIIASCYLFLIILRVELNFFSEERMLKKRLCVCLCVCFYTIPNKLLLPF